MNTEEEERIMAENFEDGIDMLSIIKGVFMDRII